MSQFSFTLFLLVKLIGFTITGSVTPLMTSRQDGTKQVAEKVYLHIDRNNYISGEDIWFKAYVIDPSTNRLSQNTNNLHVELIAPDSKILLSRVIRIEKGTGKGDFHLGDQVPSGRYRVRAYTNFMRNYDEKFFFLKEITILNPYDDAKSLNQPVIKIENKIDFTFFPEGGSLIDNVASSLAYKAVNSLGRGCDVTIKLFSSNGDLVTSFSSAYRGMGYFKIMPIPGHTYYAVVQSQGGAEMKVELPKSFPKGVVIHTAVESDKKLMLTVSTNEATLPSLADQDLMVSLSSRNLVNRTTRIRINSLVNNFSLPLDSMPDGIIRVTLSSPGGLPLCERLVFFQKNSDSRLNISTDKSIYKPREKVSAEISVTGGAASAGDFSFSAAESRFTDSLKYSGSIASWFLLESDVRGEVEEAAYYFDPDNNNRLKDLDLLLMTQGWRDFKWKYDSRTGFDHEVGFTLSGLLKKGASNNPDEGVKLSLSLSSSGSTQLFDAVTGKDGTFRFSLLDVDGNVKAYITSSGKNDNLKARLRVDSSRYDPPVIEKLRPFSVELVTEKNYYTTYQEEVIVKLNNLKKYKLKDTINLGEVTVTATRKETPQEIKVKESRILYARPDKELIVSRTMENFAGDPFSFMSGRIAGVRIVRGVDPCSIYFPNDAEVYIREQFILEQSNCSTDPKKITGASSNQTKGPIVIKRGALVLLDGYEITPANQMSILNLPMNLIDRVDVLTASPLYGMRGANGVVNIITRSGVRRDPIELSPNTVITSVKGFDVSRVFYSPNHNNPKEQSNIPDYRTTILWAPEIKTGANKTSKLEFFNADNPAKIKLTVEGITDSGVPLSKTISYEVK